MAESTIQATLADIREQFDRYFNERRNPGGNEFITYRELEKVWSDRSDSFYRKLGPVLSKDEFELIKKDSLKTLSILVYTTHLSKSQFRPEILKLPEYQDKRLPISIEGRNTLTSKLGTSIAELFMRYQYSFAPVIFRQCSEPMIVGPSEILPFVKRDTTKLGSGSSGAVYRETIVAGCFVSEEAFENPRARPVARKSMTREDAKIEIKNLIKYRQSDKKQENIMTYLCIYHTENESHILYECAHADLQHFLYCPEFDDCMRSSASLIPVLKHASTLAKGLDHLHHHFWNKNDGGFIGSHLDLKPSNILAFKRNPDGIWKISDLGIAKLKPNSVDTSKTTAKRNSGKFQAPEVHKGRTVGRGSDIWSLGCILILLTTRAVLGRGWLHHFTEALTDPDGLTCPIGLLDAPSYSGTASPTETRSDRLKDDFFYDGQKLKDAVEDWLCFLTFPKGPFVSALAEALIVKDSVIVRQMRDLHRIIRQMLEIDMSKRCNAAYVSDELKRLSDNLEKHSTGYDRCRVAIEADLNFAHCAPEDQITSVSAATVQRSSGQESASSGLKTVDLQVIIPKLQPFVQKKLLTEIEHERATSNFKIAVQTDMELSAWIRDANTTLLGICDSAQVNFMSSITKIVYAVAREKSRTAIAYFTGQRGEGPGTPTDLLRRLVNSFISQLLEHDNTSLSDEGSFPFQRFADLDTNGMVISDATQLITELLAQYDRDCFFIIDDFEAFCPRNAPVSIHDQWRQLLRALHGTVRSDRQTSPTPRFKILIRSTGSLETLKSVGITTPLRLQGIEAPDVELRRSLKELL